MEHTNTMIEKSADLSADERHALVEARTIAHVLSFGDSEESVSHLLGDRQKELQLIDYIWPRTHHRYKSDNFWNGLEQLEKLLERAALQTAFPRMTHTPAQLALLVRRIRDRTRENRNRWTHYFEDDQVLWCLEEHGRPDNACPDCRELLRPEHTTCPRCETPQQEQEITRA